MTKKKEGRRKKITLPTSAFFPETGHNLFPGSEDILITRDGELGASKSVQTTLVKPTPLFLVTSSPFTASSPDPAVWSPLHVFTVSLSERFKSCQLCSLLRSLFPGESSLYVYKLNKICVLFSC